MTNKPVSTIWINVIGGSVEVTSLNVDDDDGSGDDDDDDDDNDKDNSLRNMTFTSIALFLYYQTVIKF